MIKSKKAELIENKLVGLILLLVFLVVVVVLYLLFRDAINANIKNVLGFF